MADSKIANALRASIHFAPKSETIDWKQELFSTFSLKRFKRNKLPKTSVYGASLVKLTFMALYGELGEDINFKR